MKARVSDQASSKIRRSLVASVAFFHFAAMAWLTLDEPVDPLSREELEKHKRELLLVARDLLGIGAPAREAG